MHNNGNSDDLFHLKRLFSESETGDELQQRLNDVFPALIYVYDAEKKKLRYINRKVTDVLGYSYDEISSLDEGFFGLVFKDDQDRVKEEIEKFYLLEDNNSHLYECRLNSKQGEWRYFRTRGTILRRNDSGQPGSMLFIAEDITEQFKSAEEIKQLRQLQRETESLLGFGVFTYDLSNGETEWSDGIYHLLEHAPDKEGPGLTFEHYLNYITEPDRQMLQNVMQRSIEAKSTFTATYHILTEKNKRKVISTRGKLVLADDGSVDKVVGSMLDITEEVARQEELEAFKLNMDEKEQFLDFGSWEEEMPEGNVTWSDGMYRLFGYDPDKDGGLLHINEELYKKHLSTEDWERSVRIRLDALDHQDDFSAEFNIVTAAGSSRRLQTFAKVIRDQQNQVVKIIGTTRDITQLRAYERNLESIVNDLNRSNKDLEEFAYIASHDLQEPLRKLSTFSERLISRHGAELGPEGKKYTERILAATDNMRILIENLLEFSRTARSSIPFGKVDLNSIMDQVISDLEIVIEQSGATINVQRLPVVEAISSQMQQLFSNLIGNSLKFRKTDVFPRVDIAVRLLQPKEKKEYSLSDSQNYYGITVTDNCIGFEQEYAVKIFQIFQRLHGKVEYPGSGVGLAICKKIVDNHRGIIFANSTPGEGTVFTIILPEEHH